MFRMRYFLRTANETASFTMRKTSTQQQQQFHSVRKFGGEFDSLNRFCTCVRDRVFAYICFREHVCLVLAAIIHRKKSRCFRSIFPMIAANISLHKRNIYSLRSETDPLNHGRAVRKPETSCAMSCCGFCFYCNISQNNSSTSCIYPNVQHESVFTRWENGSKLNNRRTDMNSMLIPFIELAYR